MNPIEYRINANIQLKDFISLLKASTLADRRPIEDEPCLQGMLENSDLTVSAWDGERLVGIARSVTDFHYACYLSDLAVDQAYQRQGIGIRLQKITQEQLKPRCKLILIAAPAANDYYPALGYAHSPRCWVIPSTKYIGLAE